MALASLFPKGFFDKKPDAPTPSIPTPPSGTPGSTSEEPQPGRDKDGKFKLPPIAVYVSGAAFALTICLTAMVVPHVRKAGRQTKIPPTFLSHAHTHVTLRPGRIKPSHAEAALPVRSQLLSKTNTISPRTIKTVNAVAGPSKPLKASSIAADEVIDEQAQSDVLTSRRFNTQEERILYGTSEAEMDDDKVKRTVSPLIGFYALGIATGIVGLSAGLGVWVTAKIMGVKTVEEFSQKIRDGMANNMPALVEAVDKAKAAERSEMGKDITEEAVWDHWTETILGEDPPKERVV